MKPQSRASFVLSLLFGGYILLSFVLLMYSYTQVDLNLTLSQVSIWQTIQKTFQSIGYFHRPTSTVLFLSVLFMQFLFYGIILFEIQRKRISQSWFWKCILISTGIILFSYPAFSYDFFNYMFTAKTVLVYHKNPYEVIPLQFTGVESWLTFMRWTHLPSAYTPLWILTTLIPYLLGFGYFLLIMWNIKIVLAACFLLTVLGIGKILDTILPEKRLLGMAVFAFNPLVVIESLVSSHNDIAMMAIVVWAIVLLLRQKSLTSFFILALSVAMKLMTIFLVPLWVFKWNKYAALGLMSLGFILVCFQREVLPWYFLWIMPFVALIPERKEITILASGVALGLLLRYAPFLYFGHWDNPVPVIKIWATAVPILLSLFLSVYLFLRSQKKSRI